MKTIMSGFITLILFSGSMFAEDKNISTTITPRLGEKFGTVMVVEGRMVDDRDTRLRSHLGKSILEIRKINDRMLEKPLYMEAFPFAFSGVKFPERHTEFKFQGYETGRFTGIPVELIKGYPAATTEHHFQSHFEVTKILRPKEKRIKKSSK